MKAHGGNVWRGWLAIQPAVGCEMTINVHLKYMSLGCLNEI